MRRVAYDTSMLMLLYEGVSVFEQAGDLLASNPECIVPRAVLEELRRIAENGEGLHRRRAARLALQAVETRCRVVETVASSADDALIELALRDPSLIVATADNELRRRLRELGLPNIYYRRSRHGLMLEG
jgi:rRNA-processing protein FCF1